MKRSITLSSVFVAVLAVGLLPLVVSAQPYPNRPLNLVVPGNPGFAQDVSCRIIGEEVGKILGTQVVVLNKPGASMTLGTDFMIRAKKDGYTFLYASNTPLVYAPITTPKVVPYVALRDLEPLGGQVVFPFTVTVRQDSPWKTFGELIEHAKKHPGELRVGSPGVGSTDNFNLEIIQSMTGAKFTHVPISGSAATVPLLGGHIEVVFSPITEVSKYVKAGQMRTLLLSTKLPEFANIPTPQDLGYQQGLIYGWFALFAATGFPEEAKKALVPAIEKAMKTPEVRAKIEKLEFFVDYKSPAEFKKLWADEIERAKVIGEKVGLKK